MTHAITSGHQRTYEQIPQQHRNRHFTDRRHINRRLLLNLWCEIPLTREVNASSALAHKLQRYFVLVAGHTANHNVAERETVLEGPAGLLDDLVAALTQASTTREFLHVVDIDAVDMGAVIGQQRGEGSADDFASVYDGDGAAVESVSVRQNGIVYPEVLEDLDNGERGAGQDALL